MDGIYTYIYICITDWDYYKSTASGANNIKADKKENYEDDDRDNFMMAVSFQHKGFDHTTFSNDISLLKLDQPLEFNEWVFNDD